LKYKDYRQQESFSVLRLSREFSKAFDTEHLYIVADIDEFIEVRKTV